MVDRGVGAPVAPGGSGLSKTGTGEAEKVRPHGTGVGIKFPRVYPFLTSGLASPHIYAGENYHGKTKPNNF